MSALPAAFTLQLFSHWHESDCYPVAHCKFNALVSFITTCPVEFDSGQGRHQLQRFKAGRFRFSFTRFENRSRDSLPCVPGINKERANLSGFGPGIEVACISRRILITTKQGLPFTPAAAANQPYI